jgi:CBS domain-containing protein
MIDIAFEDIMTRDVVYATLPGSRDEVLELLKKKFISGVPVVKDGKLVGIVTRSNLLKNPEEEQTALLMIREPITSAPYEGIEAVANRMIQYNIRRLPVVENDELVGIITISDMIGAIANLDIKEPVGTYVENHIVSVWAQTPLSLVGRIMELAGVKAVPVLDTESNLVGIVSDKDLIHASNIVDTVEKSDMSAGSDEDAWTWESMRDTMSLYYSVSRIQLPDFPVKNIVRDNDLTVMHTTPVSECARKMRRGKIEYLPLVKSSQKLKGLVKDKDLLKAIA